MARKQARPRASQQMVLEPLQTTCRACGGQMRMGHHSHQTVTTLQGITRLTLKVYRCRNPECSRFHLPTRPEEEGKWALPHGEFGLDVIAAIGTWRFAHHRSVPEMHQQLLALGISIAEREVTPLPIFLGRTMTWNSFFGSVRAHERRATGRRGAIPGLVVRGSVRVLTTLVTKMQPLQISDLQPTDYQAWRDLRRQLEYRQEARRQQFRFRKNPQAYLAAIEARLLIT